MKIQLAIIASAALALAVEQTAQATPVTYDLSFNGGGSAASGEIVVDNGVATSGFLDITAGAAQGDYSLYTWTGGGGSSVRDSASTDLIVDNLVTVGGNPFLDADGLAFVSSAQSLGQPIEEIDFSLDSGTTYNLGGYGVDGYGVPNADGAATLTVDTSSVPDTASTGGMLTAVVGAMALIGKFATKRNAILGTGTLS